MSAESVNFQCLLGIQCNDFTMVASDQMNIQNIFIINDDEDKLHKISDKVIMGLNGAPGDTQQFSQFVAKNIRLYKMRNDYDLDTAAIVHFTRKSVADALKNGNPCMVNILIGGYGESGAELYTMDFLAACMKVPFATHGLSGYVCLGILDRYYKPSLTELEAYELLKMCVREIHQRMLLNLPNFKVKVVSAHGIKDMPAITPASFSFNKKKKN